MEPVIFKIPLSAPGVLAITPRPRGGDWLNDDIASLASVGFGMLVSLLGPDEELELCLQEEPTACASHGLEFVALPVRDLGAPLDSSEFLQVVTKLVDLLRDGEQIAVHCRQSVGRSGLLVVSVLVATGVPLEDAIETVSRARGVRVPETMAQLDWLRQYQGRLSGLAG